MPTRVSIWPISSHKRPQPALKPTFMKPSGISNDRIAWYPHSIAKLVPHSARPAIPNMRCACLDTSDLRSHNTNARVISPNAAGTHMKITRSIAMNNVIGLCMRFLAIPDIFFANLSPFQENFLTDSSGFLKFLSFEKSFVTLLEISRTFLAMYAGDPNLPQQVSHKSLSNDIQANKRSNGEAKQG